MTNEELEGRLGEAAAHCRLETPVEEKTAVLVNAYYLFEEAVRAVRRGEPESAVINDVLTSAAALGATGLIVNAFNNDPDKVGDSALQTGPGEYDPIAWRGLDLLLQAADEHGIGVMLTLGNYWDTYGGAQQYARLAGHKRTRQGDPRFFRDPATIALYHAFVRHLLEHVSETNAVAVKDHPAVIGFELINEARGDGLRDGGKVMRSWYAVTARLVRQLAPTKRLSSGEEGLDASPEGYSAAFWRGEVGQTWMFKTDASFTRNLEVPEFDLASVHMYPEAWNFGKRDPMLAAVGGLYWIADHARIARKTGRPLFVGEFGLRNDGLFSLEQRRIIYRAWFNCARSVGAYAVAPWMLGTARTTNFRDRYTFLAEPDAPPGAPNNPYGDVFKR